MQERRPQVETKRRMVYTTGRRRWKKNALKEYDKYKLFLYDRSEVTIDILTLLTFSSEQKQNESNSRSSS